MGNFKIELEAWSRHIQWWLDNYGDADLHLLTYEHLISIEKGSDELQKLSAFVKTIDPVIAETLIEREKMCCIWGKIVGNYDKDNHAESQNMINKLYSDDQLTETQQVLQEIRKVNEFRPEFVKVVDKYL